MKRLGGDVVNLGDVSTSSVVKGETLFDTIQMVDGYTDIIALRHRDKVLHNMLKILQSAQSSMVATEQAITRHRPCLTCSPFAKPTARLKI